MYKIQLRKRYSLRRKVIVLKINTDIYKKISDDKNLQNVRCQNTKNNFRKGV